VCRFLLPSFSGDAIDGHQWEVQTLSVGFRARACRRSRVAEEGFHLYGEVNTLMTSSKCFRLKCYAFANVLSFEVLVASMPCKP
jgi:hypothetical protein